MKTIVSLTFEERVRGERERKGTVRLRGTTKQSGREGEESAVSKAKTKQVGWRALELQPHFRNYLGYVQQLCNSGGCKY